MGSWGLTNLQNDIAEDVKSDYISLLQKGKTGEEATKELTLQYEDAIADLDDAPVFWLALADVQWDYGRLEKHVGEKAQYYIKQELTQWNTPNYQEAEGESVSREQRCFLVKLQRKLLSEQPNEKKIRQQKLYRCDWENGDVYAYRLTSVYAKEKGLINKYLFFVKIDEQTWHPGHVIPVVYFYWIMADCLLGISDIQALEYIPQFFTPRAYKNNPNRRIQYMLSILSTSSRAVPRRNLTFIGHLKNVKRMSNEDCNSYQVSWKNFEKYIIDDFQAWSESSLTE